jgi:hypothetical protein
MIIIFKCSFCSCLHVKYCVIWGIKRYIIMGAASNVALLKHIFNNRSKVEWPMSSLFCVCWLLYLKKGVFSVIKSNNSLMGQECLLSTKEFQSQHEKLCSKCSITVTSYNVNFIPDTVIANQWLWCKLTVLNDITRWAKITCAPLKERWCTMLGVGKAFCWDNTSILLIGPSILVYILTKYQQMHQNDHLIVTSIKWSFWCICWFSMRIHTVSSYTHPSAS